MKSTIRIGTRGSPLALYQAELVKSLVHREFSLLNVEIIKIKTSGDMIRRGIDHPFETKRIYTREIEESLLRGDIDIAVHSAKDMAAVLPEGLKIGAAFEREDPRDCLVSRSFKKFSELPLGARVGTSSLRRKMQLLRLNPNLIIESVHGNVGTRIQKMEDGHFDAVVLAHAAIKRLGLGSCVAEVFEASQFYPAPGQGIIVAEVREQDPDMKQILRPINHKKTERILDCERAFLRKLQGGCQLPCGIHTIDENEKIETFAILLNLEGREWVEAVHQGPEGESSRIGEELAQRILESGGAEIIEKIKKSLEAEK